MKIEGSADIPAPRDKVWAAFLDPDILAQYPGLTAQDLAVAWGYAASHPEEIEQAIRDNEEP